jgi:putative flippase GtrA
MESLSPSAPGPFSSFVRFVVCGGGVGLLSAAAVPLLATVMPWALANAVITVVSTLLCTELHALFTFGTGRRPGWRRHVQSAGSATAAYLVTCAAMLVLHTVHSSPGLLTQQVVYLTASALAGTGRFLLLRLFVFTDRRRNDATTTVAARTRRDTTTAFIVTERPQTLPSRPTRATESPAHHGRRHDLLVRPAVGAAC